VFVPFLALDLNSVTIIGDLAAIDTLEGDAMNGNNPWIFEVLMTVSTVTILTILMFVSTFINHKAIYGFEVWILAVVLSALTYFLISIYAKTAGSPPETKHAGQGKKAAAKAIKIFIITMASYFASLGLMEFHGIFRIFGIVGMISILTIALCVNMLRARPNKRAR